MLSSDKNELFLIHILCNSFYYITFAKVIDIYCILKGFEMEITYKTKELKKCAEDAKYSIRRLGQLVSDNYTKRITALFSANTLEDVRNLPGNYHELTGNRKGQWACSLSGNYRLIFEPHEKPIPTNENGQYLWCEIKAVEIDEIVDYHK